MGWMLGMGKRDILLALLFLRTYALMHYGPFRGKYCSSLQYVLSRRKQAIYYSSFLDTC